MSLYGSNLDGTTLSVNGANLTPLAATPTQINAILPTGLSGLVTVQATGPTGSHSINVLIQPSVPAIFTQNQSGTGPASALNGITNALVTAADPLHAGDYVSLYLTGLGSQPPTVSIGGRPCRLTYAGAAPGYPGLDQINCQLPADAAPNPAASVVIQSGAFLSNAPTVAIQ